MKTIAFDLKPEVEINGLTMPCKVVAANKDELCTVGYYCHCGEEYIVAFDGQSTERMCDCGIVATITKTGTDVPDVIAIREAV